MTMVEHHGSGGVGDVLTRLHHLRRTLQECHQRMERVDCHVQALNTHPGEVNLCTLPGTSRHLGTTSGPSHTHPGVYTFPDPIERSQDDLEQDKTRKGGQAADGDQKNDRDKEEATRTVRQKDSMSEVKEAEEHLVQTEWTVVLGELTGTFELTQDEAEDEFINGIDDSASEATSGEPEARQRPSLRNQKNIEIENYDPNFVNNLRPKDNCDGDHVEEAKPFISSPHPNLLILDDHEANGIIPGTSLELCEDVIHPRARNDYKPSSVEEKLDDLSCLSLCNEDPFDMNPKDGPGPPLDAADSPRPPLDAAHSPGPPLDVTHSLDVVQKTLELLWDHFISLQNAIGDSPKKPGHHSQKPSNISSKMVKIIGCLSPGAKKGLSEECKTVPEAGRDPTQLPRQDPSTEGPREGEECTRQIISDNNSDKPESRSVAGAYPQHSNVFQSRRQELKDSLTTVLVVLLVLLALLFLACCLLLVVPVVTVSVRTLGGPPVF